MASTSVFFKLVSICLSILYFQSITTINGNVLKISSKNRNANINKIKVSFILVLSWFSICSICLYNFQLASGYCSPIEQNNSANHCSNHYRSHSSSPDFSLQLLPWNCKFDFEITTKNQNIFYFLLLFF